MGTVTHVSRDKNIKHWFDLHYFNYMLTPILVILLLEKVKFYFTNFIHETAPHKKEEDPFNKDTKTTKSTPRIQNPNMIVIIFFLCHTLFEDLDSGLGFWFILGSHIL